MTYHPRNPKIDVYVRSADGKSKRYLHSTNWHRTCREAVAAAEKAWPVVSCPRPLAPGERLVAYKDKSK